MEVRMQATVTSNPAQTMRLSKPRTTAEQRKRTAEIQALRGRLGTRLTFARQAVDGSKEHLAHLAAAAEYERAIAKLEGAKDA